MRSDIAEINSRYEIFQDYLYPTTEFFLNLAQADSEQFAEYQRLKKLYQPEFEILMKRLMEIIKAIDPIEVAEAYTEGCRLLQSNLSGFMGQHFCDEYYRVMVNAIYAKHLHTSWLFLQAIADNLGEKVSPLIEFAIEIEALQETALSIIHQLKLKQFKPQVENLFNGNLQSLAQSTLDALE